MEKVYTIDIRSWTASFRYPNLISGVQPTLEVPPLSTVLGMINAAAGFYTKYETVTIGYYFEYQAKEYDLETIYMIDSNKGQATNNAKSNIIKREFLFENFLRVYVLDKQVITPLLSPVFPLVLGRISDLATVESGGIQQKSLPKVENATNIRGQIIPFANNYLPGVIQALPKYFSDTIPRQNIGTEAYSVINYFAKVRSNLSAYRDIINGREVDIYMHTLNFNNI